ncbi:MAG: hypothetical protein K0S23_1580 [Fluviicola sp.]|jgi:hypothetical protein|uniref:peptidase M23 n=1 Tax=Fluviicola sp. TaxID=1917219 RepID=UPI002615380E|nr:peptidase M23 [Fluviicola sp.]MDF3027273.1 hypothetical protein [Fluviicola sp.]
MKKHKLSYLILPLLILILAGCSATKADDVDKAAEEVEDAKLNLDEANRQYAKEVASYRTSMETDLRNNKLRIAELKEERTDAKADALADRNAKIEAIQKRNDELDSRMRQYRSDNRENWKEFKSEFNHDMDELGKAFKDLGQNNVK